jgi:autotransporter passenger strand-loop-strand repeat protein
VASGGVATNDTIYFGLETVSSGGKMISATVSGGTAIVLKGGLASAATANTGSVVVSNGGTAASATIAGGAVVLQAGAVVSGGITFAGSGTLRIFGSAMPSATISGFTSGDTVDLASVASRSGGAAVLASGNVLDVQEGGSTYALQLDPSQNFSGVQFVLTSDGTSGTDVTFVPFSGTVSSGATLTVSSGHTSNTVHVLGGGTLNILSGGTAIGTFVDSGGTARVSGTETAPQPVAERRSSVAPGLPAAPLSLATARRPISARRSRLFSSAAPRSSLPAVPPVTPPSTVAARCLSSAMALPIRQPSTPAARRPSARAAPTSARKSPGASRSTPGSPAAR